MSELELRKKKLDKKPNKERKTSKPMTKRAKDPIKYAISIKSTCMSIQEVYHFLSMEYLTRNTGQTIKQTNPIGSKINEYGFGGKKVIPA